MLKEEIKIPSDRIKPLIKGSKIFRSVYDYHLTEEDLKQAYLELGETENVRKSSLESLKAKLSGEVNLLANTDDPFLLRYLRYHKFNVEEAYSMLCRLYKLRTDYPELFSLPSNIETLLAADFIKNLPYRDEEGSIIFWVDFSKECYPWRIKRVVLFHSSTLVRIVFNSFRYFLTKKLADRVVMLGDDVTELHEYINPALLPKEYGGDIEETECSMKEFLLQNMSYMKYQRSFKFSG